MMGKIIALFPITSGGRQALKGELTLWGYRPIVPDNWRFEDTDWDEVAETAERWFAEQSIGDNP